MPDYKRAFGILKNIYNVCIVDNINVGFKYHDFLYIKNLENIKDIECLKECLEDLNKNWYMDSTPINKEESKEDA